MSARRTTLALVLVAAATAGALAGRLGLEWDPSPTAEIDGYNLYLALPLQTNGVYPWELVQTLGAGTTNTTVTNLPDGRLAAFYVTAFRRFLVSQAPTNYATLESEPSNVVEAYVTSNPTNRPSAAVLRLR